MKHAKTVNSDFVGQDFDEFLNDEGIASEVETRAIKKVVVALLSSMDKSQEQLAKELQAIRPS